MGSRHGGCALHVCDENEGAMKTRELHCMEKQGANRHSSPNFLAPSPLHQAPFQITTGNKGRGNCMNGVAVKGVQGSVAATHLSPAYCRSCRVGRQGATVTGPAHVLTSPP